MNIEKLMWTRVIELPGCNKVSPLHDVSTIDAPSTWKRHVGGLLYYTLLPLLTVFCHSVRV